MSQARADARRGALRPIELADAAVLGGVTVGLVLIGFFFPHASLITVLAAVPMSVVAHRHRPRAVVAAAVAGGLVAFLVAGTGPIASVGLCALIGGLVGEAKRRHWGLPRTLAAAVVLATGLAGLAVAWLTLFRALRTLTLAQIRNTWHGLARLLEHVPWLRHASRPLTRLVEVALRDWWATIAALVFGTVLVATVLVWRVLGAVLARLAATASTPLDFLDAEEPSGPPDPVPVALVDVRYRYSGAAGDALAGVSLVIEPAQFVAVLGPNGSGKSTLTRLLAGRAPTAGEIIRPGPPGLGRPGGTAMILQRPESQVLGVRVADDVVWGLSPSYPVDVAGLLGAVGLVDMADRDTSTLSGGELQRLAVAAALARQPRLLVSDESTAMVDAAGRDALTRLLGRLPGEYGMTVVHVTHRAAEAVGAHQVIALSEGRVVDRPVLARRDRGEGVEAGGASRLGGLGGANIVHRGGPSPGAGDAAARPIGAPVDPVGAAGSVGGAAGSVGGPAGSAVDLVRLQGVGHVYAAGTPWAQRSLRGVDLTAAAGDGVLVVGGNGSGKSTLAWILAGLIVPSEGHCWLAGRPVSDQVGAVGLAFQHARLQLQRATVRADVRSAGAVDAERADAALAAVGLDPAEIGDRPIDRLSGGQVRRVALAGLLARDPRVLVLDEPLAGLDDASRRGLLSLLGRLRAERGLTLFVVSHDLEGMAEVCDRVVTLEEGVLVGDGTLGPSWS